MNLRTKNLVVLFPWDILLLSFSGFMNQIEDLGKHFKSIMIFGFEDVKETERIINIIEHNSIFMTFIPGGMNGLKIAKILRKNHRKFFLRTHSTIAEEFKVNHKFFGTLLYPLIKLCSDVVMKEAIKGDVPNFSTGRILYPKLKKQHKILSCSFLKARKEKKRKEGNFEEPYKLLYVGKLEPKKGVKYLLSAVANLKYDFELHIVGGGRLLKQLIRLAISLGIDEKVNFHNHIHFGETLLDFYRWADICIVPSLEEMQGKTWLEAMSFGLPVIATNIDGINNYVIDEVNGLLVTPKSPFSISMAVENLIEDKVLRQKVVNGGYRFAVRNDIKEMNKGIVEVLRKEW